MNHDNEPTINEQCRKVVCAIKEKWSELIRPLFYMLYKFYDIG